MNKETNAILKTIAVLAFLYLLGAFVAAETDVRLWDPALRVCVAICALAFSPFVYITSKEE